MVFAFLLSRLSARLDVTELFHPGPQIEDLEEKQIQFATHALTTS
jgi:hypothetical protein